MLNQIIANPTKTMRTLEMLFKGEFLDKEFSKKEIENYCSKHNYYYTFGFDNLKEDIFKRVRIEDFTLTKKDWYGDEITFPAKKYFYVVDTDVLRQVIQILNIACKPTNKEVELLTILAKYTE